MSTMKDVARVISMRNKIPVKQAEAFMSLLIDVLKTGLNDDGIVKVKGLGTFKLLRVRERESIDVNTGKRVVIGSHDRITFTPDNTMKDSVNKPFAHFETVILNDGVSFEDTPDENETEIPEEEPETTVVPEEPVQEVVHQVKVAKPEQAPVQEEKIKEEKKEEEKKEEKKEEEVEEKVEEKVEEEKKEEEVEEEESGNHNTGRIIGFVACFIIAFVMGFLAGRNNMIEKILPSDNKQEVATSSEPATAKTDTSKTVKGTTKAVSPKQATANPQDKTPQNQQNIEYNKDPRYRYGAYIITGTNTVHTVKAGQTLKGISKSYLGPNMEVYIEVYNGGIKEVKPGQKINIPEIRLKKAAKKKK